MGGFRAAAEQIHLLFADEVWTLRCVSYEMYQLFVDTFTL